MSVGSSHFRFGMSRLLFTVVVFLLAACETSTEIPETTLGPSTITGLATSSGTLVSPPLFNLGEGCSPPCWEGLIPGISIRQEVWDVIEAPLFQQWSEENSYGADDYLLIKPEDDPNTFTMLILQMNDDIFSSIQGNIDSDIHIDDVISLIGPPPYIAPYRPIAECMICDQRDYPSIESLELVDVVYLLYPEEGVYFQARVDARDWGCLCPNMRLTRFCYIADRAPMELIDRQVLVDTCSLFVTSVETIESHGPWEGYTETE